MPTQRALAANRAGNWAEKPTSYQVCIRDRGHTGQGQDIHRTQHIQGRLEHQHGGGGIGRDDIIAGPGRGGTTGGIEHQYQQNKHRAQGQNQAKLFTDDPKDQVLSLIHI